MVSKIIQKEKERQEEHLKHCGGESDVGVRHPLVGYTCCRAGDIHNYCYSCRVKITGHMVSLISLKEYLEKLSNSIREMEGILADEFGGFNEESSYEESNQIKEDIAELTKMIELYSH